MRDKSKIRPQFRADTKKAGMKRQTWPPVAYALGDLNSKIENRKRKSSIDGHRSWLRVIGDFKAKTEFKRNMHDGIEVVNKPKTILLLK